MKSKDTKTKDHKRLSKRLSFVLRHNPASIDIELDTAGWVDLDLLVAQLDAVGNLSVTADEVVEMAAANDKKRFEIVDGRIRAAQGHSVDVQLGLDPIDPPAVLWHGTVDRFLDSILANGLRPSGRTHVHLSADVETARDVGSRRGTPVLLRIDATAMHNAGHKFYRSANGVWLADTVAPQWIHREDAT